MKYYLVENTLLTKEQAYCAVEEDSDIDQSELQFQESGHFEIYDTDIEEISEKEFLNNT